MCRPQPVRPMKRLLRGDDLCWMNLVNVYRCDLAGGSGGARTGGDHVGNIERGSWGHTDDHESFDETRWGRDKQRPNVFAIYSNGRIGGQTLQYKGGDWAGGVALRQGNYRFLARINS